MLETLGRARADTRRSRAWQASIVRPKLRGLPLLCRDSRTPCCSASRAWSRRWESPTSSGACPRPTSWTTASSPTSETCSASITRIRTSLEGQVRARHTARRDRLRAQRGAREEGQPRPRRHRRRRADLTEDPSGPGHQGERDSHLEVHGARKGPVGPKRRRSHRTPRAVLRPHGLLRADPHAALPRSRCDRPSVRAGRDPEGPVRRPPRDSS